MKRNVGKGYRKYKAGREGNEQTATPPISQLFERRNLLDSTNDAIWLFDFNELLKLCKVK